MYGGRGMCPAASRAGFHRRVKAHQAARAFQLGHNLRRAPPVHIQAFARGQALAAHQRFPGQGVLAAQEQQFHLPAGGLARKDARRNDARLVDHQQVAGAQVVADVPEGGVLQLGRVAAQHQQARVVARLDGRLRDPLRGKVVIEIEGLHAGGITANAAGRAVRGKRF